MDDDRFARRLRLIDAPTLPSPAFVEDLHALLIDELDLGDVPRPAASVPVQRRMRRSIALIALAAALLVGLGVVGSGLVGNQPTVQPIPPPSPSASPAATPASSRTASAPPSTVAPSLEALRGSGLVVFEHWDLPNVGPIRLERLAADSTGHDLLPDMTGVQQAPAWSLDGTRLAFAGYDPSATQRSSIWETDSQGATPTLLTTGCTPLIAPARPTRPIRPMANALPSSAPMGRPIRGPHRRSWRSAI